MARKPARDDWFACPHCGAKVAAGAGFCRACGASAESGWNDDEIGRAEDDDFDYDDFVRREFPDDAPSEPLSARKLLIALVIGLLIFALLAWSFG